MKICINAGHTKLGSGTGANCYLNESVETRKIAYELMKILADSNHEVIPAVFDKSSNNLKDVVDLANKSKCDLFISIHFNAGKGTGTEVYTWKGQKHSYAVGICEELNKLGFRNRGVKNGSSLYVIKNTTMKAMIIEVCFVDNLKDYELYKKLGINKIASAIADGIVSK